MKLLLAFSLLLSSGSGVVNGQASYPQVTQRTFIDDTGMTHTTRKANPKIICSARTALSLLHQFKIDGSQIAGTYGNYFPRGSIGDINDPDYTPYWPTDPTRKELEFLSSIPTFSPTCYHAKNTKCDELDVKAAIASGGEKWVEVGNGNWHTGADVKEIVASMGNLPIFISTHYEGNVNPGCIAYSQTTATYTTKKEKCKQRSLIDVIKRTNELANFLGINKIDIAVDQKKMCDAASALTDAALSAQRRGVRVMVVNPSISADNAVSMYPVSPLSDPFLRSYEELGVPLLHPGKHTSALKGTEVISSKEWFTDCQPGQMFKNCNSKAFYPVDLYLIEGRRFFFNTPEEQYFLQTFFPDKALLNNQVVHWPLNDGAISYTSAARSFDEMTRKLNEAVKQYDSTQCVNTDVTAISFLSSQFGGLKGGEYACYYKQNLQLDYLQCNVADLAGGKQMVTTFDENKEPEFKPAVSAPVTAKTIAKQNKKTVWTVERKREVERNASAIIAMLTVFCIFVAVSFFSCIVYCFCWKSTASTAIDKTHIESVEEGTSDNITNDESSLPTIS